MSAYVYIAAPDASAGYLFADGAGYDEAGIVGSLTQKISCGKVSPFAITTVGHQMLGDMIKEFLVEQADRLGVDDFVEQFLPAFLPEIGLSYAEHQQDAVQNVAVLISAWSETKGAFRVGFQTLSDLNRDVPILAFEPQIDSECTWRGSDMTAGDLVALMRPLRAGEGTDDFLRYLGTAMMSRMREIPSLPVHLKGSGATPRYLVGGHVDMAVVDKDGARIERLHTWREDKVGGMIVPGRPVLNRAQRRALGRAA